MCVYDYEVCRRRGASHLIFMLCTAVLTSHPRVEAFSGSGDLRRRMLGQLIVPRDAQYRNSNMKKIESLIVGK